MKKILIAIALFSAFSALAGTSTKVFEIRDSRHSERDVTTSFRVNSELGRAWINVEVTENFFDDVRYDNHRVLFKGLSLNAEGTAIVLDQDGALTECATISPKDGVFGRKLIIRPTGKCSFTPKFTKIDVDNGFEVRKIRMLQIFMNVE